MNAYSQKQLSNVGIRLDELRRFVETPVRRELDDISQKFRTLASEIRQRHAAMQRKRAVEQTIANDDLTVRSLTEQAEVIRKSLTGISDEDKACIAARAQYDEAEHILAEWRAEVERAKEAARDFGTTIEGLPSLPPTKLDELPHPDILGRIHREVGRLFDDLKQLVGEVRRRLDGSGASGSEFVEATAEWRAALDKFTSRYDAATQRSTAQESRLKELSGIEKRLGEVRTGITRRRAELASLGNPEERYAALRQEWAELHRTRATLLEEQCRRLTELSRGEIRATLKRGAGLDNVMEALRKAVSGSGLRQAKLDALRVMVFSSVDPTGKWEELLSELELVAGYDPEADTGNGVPPTPLLAQCGVVTTELTKVATRFQHEQWLEIALVPIEDQPVFEYRAREGEYMPFREASAGQQATALLNTLLNQPGPPLIIDQPEDDLDNQVILQVVEQLWEAKKKRQLVFASHNANLVVNGDAELVVACDYRVAGDHSGGKIKCQGAIDIELVRGEITRVMEGGEEAFKLRRDKYGF